LAVDHKRFSPGDRAEARRRFGKGHDVVLRAMAAIGKRERENVVYLIGGKGPRGTRLKGSSRNSTRYREALPE
jgi:hypothetical protein